MCTFGKIRALLPKHETFVAILHQHRITYPDVNIYFFVEIQCFFFFTNLKMKILKPDCISENDSPWDPFQETINNISTSLTVLSINLTKYCIYT